MGPRIDAGTVVGVAEREGPQPLVVEARGYRIEIRDPATAAYLRPYDKYPDGKIDQMDFFGDYGPDTNAMYSVLADAFVAPQTARIRFLQAAHAQAITQCGIFRGAEGNLCGHARDIDRQIKTESREWEIRRAGVLALFDLIPSIRAFDGSTDVCSDKSVDAWDDFSGNELELPPRYWAANVLGPWGEQGPLHPSHVQTMIAETTRVFANLQGLERCGEARLMAIPPDLYPVIDDLTDRLFRSGTWLAQYQDIECLQRNDLEGVCVGRDELKIGSVAAISAGSRAQLHFWTPPVRLVSLTVCNP